MANEQETLSCQQPATRIPDTSEEEVKDGTSSEAKNVPRTSDFYRTKQLPERFDRPG